MTSSAARVAHMRNWIEQLEAEIARLMVERDTLWSAIAVLDPDAQVPVRDRTPVRESIPGRTGKRWPTPEEVGAKIGAAMPAESPKPKAAKKSAPKPPATPARDVRTNQINTAAARGRPPLEEIAAVYNAAKAAKKSTGQAMADHFGVPLSTTNNWPSALRKAGLIADERGPGRPPGAPNKPKPAADAQVTQISDAPSRKPGGPVARDYVEIARHIVEFRDAGVPVAPALSKMFKVPESTAKNWMSRCREQGLVKPLVANLKVIEDNTIGDQSTAVYNAREVASSYLEAIRTNRRPIQHVADSLGIDKQTALGWVRQARLDGELAPDGEPQLPEEERRRLLDMSKPEPVA